MANKRQQRSVKNSRRLQSHLNGVALKSWQQGVHLFQLFLLEADVYGCSQLGKRNTLLNIYISHSLGQLKNVGLQFPSLQRSCEECYSRTLIAMYFSCSLIYCVVVFILVVFLMLPVLIGVSLKQHEPRFIFLANKNKVRSFINNTLYRCYSHHLETFPSEYINYILLQNSPAESENEHF